MDEPTVRRIWETALGQLQLQVTRPNYETWLKGTVGLRLDNGHFVIGTRSDFANESLSSKMRPLIAKTLSAIIGKPVEVSFQLITHNGNGHEQSFEAPLFKAADPAQQAVISNPLPKPVFNEKYTFERLIVGDFNRLAAASALAAADQPGQLYNPLFIYGFVGLGKTHLLHAIGQRLLKRGLQPLYVSAEQFTNDFVSAIAQGRSDEFRRRYRSAQALLIDDIHFLASKERTQEEFFYTFNDLHASGRQIVITSDRLPQAITPLETRLRSRFRWGLIVDIQAPDLECRLAILRRKALEQRTDLPPDVARLLADRIQDNIRDLEGSLNRVIAYARLNRSPITIALAEQALSAFSPPSHTSPPTPDTILQTVCNYFSTSLNALRGKSRAQPMTTARHIIMFLLREDAHLPLKEIGRLLGNRDHSTIIHGCQKITTLLKHDPQLRLHITEIRSLLRK